MQSGCIIITRSLSWTWLYLPVIQGLGHWYRMIISSSPTWATEDLTRHCLKIKKKIKIKELVMYLGVKALGWISRTENKYTSKICSFWPQICIPLENVWKTVQEYQKETKVPSNASYLLTLSLGRGRACEKMQTVHRILSPGEATITLFVLILHPPPLEGPWKSYGLWLLCF